MFNRSVWVVLAIMVVVCVSGFTSQYLTASQLPSTYDTGLGIQEAFKTAKGPLLVEFYSDTCGTCQRVTPWLHHWQRQHPKKLTLVMLNVEDPNTQPIGEIFGVKTLPALYVFNPKRMKKTQVQPASFQSEQTLTLALQEASQQL
jgi:thiol-disulfide isomerase/thioredoxin